jgi:hypothetical protein
MIQDHNTPEGPPYRHASLNGKACEAIAWVQTTAINALDGKGHSCRVEGIRSWRGRALIDRDVFPSLPCDSTMRYTGKLKNGDEELDISAEVFLHSARCYVTDPEEHRQTYVEFVGAGNPFR